MNLSNIAKLVLTAGLSSALIDATRNCPHSFTLQTRGEGRKDVIPEQVLEDMIKSDKFHVFAVTALVNEVPPAMQGLIDALRENGMQVRVIGGGDLLRAMAAFDGPLCEAHHEEAMRQGVYTTEEMAKFFEVPKKLIDPQAKTVDVNINVDTAGVMDAVEKTILSNVDFSKISIGYKAPEPDALTFARDRLEACRKDLAQFEANISDNITRGQRMVHDHTELMAECHKLNERAAKAKDEIKRWEAVVAAL